MSGRVTDPSPSGERALTRDAGPQTALAADGDRRGASTTRTAPVGTRDRQTTRHVVVLVSLGVAALALAVVGIAFGSVTIPIGDVVKVLTGGHASQPVWDTIITQLRLPRTVCAVTVGAGLGVAGLALQTLFRNPLADPLFLGTEAGATLGVAAVVLASAGTDTGFVAGLSLSANLGVAAAAALGAALVTAVVLLAARRRGTTSVLLFGLMVSYAVNALVTLLVAQADPNRLQRFLSWGYGSFDSVSWGQLAIMGIAVGVGILMTIALVGRLNVLLLGERYAATMGVDVRRTRVLTILASALIAGAITAFAGPIGFLGIAVPHLARGLLGTGNHRWLLPAVILTGICLALVAELLADLPGTTLALPLNGTTALIGAPVVVFVLFRRRALEGSP